MYVCVYLISYRNCSIKFPESLEDFYFPYIYFQCMSVIEDMTKEMQEVRDEHLGQIKEVSTNVPTDNKFEIYQQISDG